MWPGGSGPRGGQGAPPPPREQPPIGAVVGGAQVTALRGGEDEPVDRLLTRHVKGRRPSRDSAVFDLQVLGAADVVVAPPDPQHESAPPAPPPFSPFGSSVPPMSLWLEPISITKSPSARSPAPSRLL